MSDIWCGLARRVCASETVTMSMEPLILAVETATLAGSIAIMRGGEVVGTSNGDPAVSHSNTLLADLDRLLSETRIKLPHIDLFAVAAGPGSFTGLRIGIATVKALAATLDRPCAAIPTLQAIALAGALVLQHTVDRVLRYQRSSESNRLE